MLRVLSIAHPAMGRATGRLRYGPLGRDPELELHLLVPQRWYEFGRWLAADPQAEAGITVHVAPVRLPRMPVASWYLHHYPGLGGLIRRINPDVIHLWEESWSVVAWQALLLRKRLAPRAAIVLEVDQNILKRLPQPFQAIRRHVLRNVDHVLARSPDALDVVRACGYGGPAGYLGYGVSQDIFRPGDRLGARAEFGLQGLVIGYVGRLVIEKGLDDMLHAMALSAAPVHFVMLGEGPYQASLEATAERLGLADRVRIFPRAEPHRVARFIAALDALVLLTRTTKHVREQFGRVIIEAHACGVPVIGSSCGAIPSVVGEGGWIVPESSPAELAALFNRLDAEPQQLTAAGSRGARQVAEHYTLERVAAALATAWRDAARRRNALPPEVAGPQGPAWQHGHQN